MKSRTRQPKQPESNYLEDGIGYVKVPPCFNVDADKDQHFADTIRKQIRKLDTEKMIKGWVVDLRQNTGGNMWPMLAGLNALMKDGTVGYFVYPITNDKIGWKSKNGVIRSSGKKG